MRILGHILLWAGFLAGSLLTVFNSTKEGVEFVKGINPDEVKGFAVPDLSSIELPENGWHLIPWPAYSVAAFVCLVGVILLHKTRLESTEKSEVSAANLNEIKNALARAIGNTKALAAESPKIAPSKIVAQIDDEIAVDLRVFAEGRNSMTTEYGLTVFANVMSPFAAGERAINRAWSAAADGYVDEATDCLNRGHQMLVDAQNELAQAEKHGSNG